MALSLETKTRFADVILPVGPSSLDRIFTYEIPDGLELAVGLPVLVPFRSGKATGFIVQFLEESTVSTKSILGIDDSLHPLSPATLEFSRWLADRYLSPWWETLRLFIVHRTKIRDTSHLLQVSEPKSPLADDFASERAMSATDAIISRNADANKINPLSKLSLNEEQEKAFAEIKGAIGQLKYKEFLLHGITGSGKTEVYLTAADEVLKKNRTAIILVPEIPLSFHVAKRFREVFGESVAVLHSTLTEKEQRNVQEAVLEGRTKILIGPRMALFAPMKKTGLIVIDEEHDPSYKQEQHPRYHARTVAEKIAESHQAVLLLGSATPSVETYSRTTAGDRKSGDTHSIFSSKKIEWVSPDFPGLPPITLLTLHDRYESRPLPIVQIADMRQEQYSTTKPFSALLLNELRKTLESGQQAILFVSRRGFSPLVLCPDCGYAFDCPHCSISLNFHLARKKLSCHYCDYGADAPEQCPDCKGMHLTYRGFGTQRVEEVLKTHLPEAKILRLDRDSTSKRGATKAILDAFTKREADILLGTQMVTKGFDFPHVNLVGIVYADHLLHFPDFRSAEFTFQLLTQVAGRAGRGLSHGTVILQTYDPEHPAIVAAVKHDYRQFYDQEIIERKSAAYPPFTSMANIVFSGQDEQSVEHAAMEGSLFLEKGAFIKLGPAPCPIEKINKNYRWHIILKSDDIGTLIKAGKELNQWFSAKKSKKIRLTIDIDPIRLL